jgi:mannose-6-phosphate isomerase
MSNLYTQPALLTPSYFPYIWGGTLLRDHLGKDIPTDDIGESWEVSAHPRGQSTVASGPARGMAFGDWAQGEEFYGDARFDKFPLLIKFLGARDNLSVQVHPGDDNCRPGEAGKAEAWVVLACEPGAELIYDIRGTAEEFAQAVAEGRMAEALRRIRVAPGDVLDIPAGMVHALMAGVVVYEVQQNSDTTYRLYDWGRVDAKTGQPRELHIEVALRVIRPGSGPKSGGCSFWIGDGFQKFRLAHNPRFTLERLTLTGSHTDDGHSGFAAYSVIAGEGAVLKDGRECFRVNLGDSFVSPAAAGPVELDGNMTLLKSYVPLQLDNPTI